MEDTVSINVTIRSISTIFFISIPPFSHSFFFGRAGLPLLSAFLSDRLPSFCSSHPVIKLLKNLHNNIINQISCQGLAGKIKKL